MAIEFLVMPLSHYLAGDFVTPAMRNAWEEGTPYRCQSPEGPREMKKDVPWGGGAAPHRRGSLYAPLDGWLKNLPLPIPQNLWDEHSDLPPRFHRLDALAGLEAMAYTELRKQVAGHKVTGRPLFGLDLPRGEGGAPHSGASLFLPCEFDPPFEMTAPLKKATGSAVLAARELEHARCPSYASRPREVLLAALRDALDLHLPLILIEVEDEPPTPPKKRLASKGATSVPATSRALALAPNPFPLLTDAVWQEIQMRVGAGFDNHESLLYRIFETMGEELDLGDDVTDITQLDESKRSLLQDAIQRAFVRRMEEMQAWPVKTDCERLQAAFDALGKHGIVALENCGFTQEDGRARAAHVAVVRDELGTVANDGYCFCHDQDVVRALEGDGLYLAFGSFREETGSHRQEVGEAVVRACLDQGLKVDWNLSPDTRIALRNFSWQRRLVSTKDSDVQEFIESWETEIRAGYTPADELRAVLDERAGDWFAGFADFGRDLLRRLHAHTEKFLKAEEAREATWSEPTINDRITAAFEELGQRCVLASECSGLTIHDGWGYAGLNAKRTDRGVVFFHREDVVDGVSGLGLFLAYGALGTQPSDDEAVTRMLAQEIVGVLGTYAIPCTWGGSTRERIRVAPFEWRKRRWTTAPQARGAPSSQPKPSSVWSRLFGRKTSGPVKGLSENVISAARRAAIVVTAVSDERRFDLRRSKQMRAAWKALGAGGEGQMGHLGNPHVFVRAGELTTVLPWPARENLREEKTEVFLRAVRCG
jgi:hypothetical protein